MFEIADNFHLRKINWYLSSYVLSIFGTFAQRLYSPHSCLGETAMPAPYTRL
jgi:hypothetical protein